MPLIILGLLLLIGLLIYSIIRYMASGEEIDERPVRERYPHAFPSQHNGDNESEPPIEADSYYDEDSFRGDIDHMLRNIKYDVKDRAEDLKDKAKERGIDIDRIRNDLGKNSSGGKSGNKEDNTVEFPKDNIEEEKRKRNINSD